eukprot:GHVU01225908.1.p1 GENE.GHVU01225908.1~~GHVU01225908.1.p1  ORF type:complete len:430 (-),score=88.06 GHVU01225908.1:49-1212(-)
MSTQSVQFPDARDVVPLEGIDHVEFFCGNAKQAAHWYRSVMGFTPIAYAGLETGEHTRTSYMLQQGDIRLVLTSGLKRGDVGAFVDTHGDGVKRVAFTVCDAKAALSATAQRGAEPSLEPTTLSDAHGEAVVAGVRTYGDVEHIFVERKNYDGPFLPGYADYAAVVASAGDEAGLLQQQLHHEGDVGLTTIDHVVGNVGCGEVPKWAAFYEKVFGFARLLSFDESDINTAQTSLKSTVMTSSTGLVKLPINEPGRGAKTSQIQEFLDFNGGAGVQHLAVETCDIIKTVRELRRRGTEFLRVTGDYYDTVEERVGRIDEDLSVLKELGVLVDRDADGYLLQIFTKPVTDRPTFFYEIIQRKGARSFGKGNFNALFQSIEEEQARRGTL